MDSKYLLVFIIFSCGNVLSSSLVDVASKYLLHLGKTNCLYENDFWTCAQEKAGKILDSAEAHNNKQRLSWQEAADAEVSLAKTYEEPPSKLGIEVEESLLSVADMVRNSMARVLSRKHSDGDGIDSINPPAEDTENKEKTAKLQLVSPVMIMKKNEDHGLKVQSWIMKKQLENNSINVAMDDNIRENFEVVMDGSTREARNILSDISFADVGKVAEHATKNENVENWIAKKSSIEEHRGKKKKDMGILTLMMLGSVMKAKIVTLLQILSFKLQVKFFLIALIGLAINVARFFIDIKKQHQQNPPKVHYYEHAQHQQPYEYVIEEP